MATTPGTARGPEWLFPSEDAEAIEKNKEGPQAPASRGGSPLAELEGGWGGARGPQAGRTSGPLRRGHGAWPNRVLDPASAPGGVGRSPAEPPSGPGASQWLVPFPTLKNFKAGKCGARDKMTMNVPGTASQRCQAQNVSRPLRPFLFRGPLGQSRGMLLCRLPPGHWGKSPLCGDGPPHDGAGSQKRNLPEHSP